MSPRSPLSLAVEEGGIRNIILWVGEDLPQDKPGIWHAKLGPSELGWCSCTSSDEDPTPSQYGHHWQSPADS